MDIRKSIRITKDEEKQLLEEMALSGVTNFSKFIRKKLFQNEQSISSINEIARHFYNLNRANQLEKIHDRLYQIKVISEEAKQVDAYKMDQVMDCFRDLLEEAERTIPLSDEFKEKWL